MHSQPCYDWTYVYCHGGYEAEAVVILRSGKSRAVVVPTGFACLPMRIYVSFS